MPEIYTKQQVDQIVGDAVKASQEIILPIGGQWGIQNNEVNAWGVLGFVDNNNTQDVGNYTNKNTLNSVNFGGYTLPYDAYVVDAHIKFRVNNADVIGFTWMLYEQDKVVGGANPTTLKYESALITPGNNSDQEHNFTAADMVNNNFAAKNVISLAVGCPTQGINRNAQVYGGYVRLRKA